MANIPLQRGIGPNLSTMVQLLVSALQRRGNLNQIEKARSQAFGPQVGVGGTPVDFNRNLGMGVRQAPSMGENITPYVPSDITQVGGGGQAEFMRQLLTFAASNPQAKELLGLESAFMPQYSFINQEGGGLQQVTKDPLGGEPSVKQIVESRFAGPRNPQDRKILERVKDGKKIATYQRPDGSRYDVSGDVDPRRPSTGGSFSRAIQLEKLRDQFNQIEKDLLDLSLGMLRGKTLRELVPSGVDVEKWKEKQVEQLKKSWENKADSIKKLEGELDNEDPLGIR